MSIFDKHLEGAKQFQISWLTLHMGKHILKPLPFISECVYLTSFAQEQVCDKSGRTTFRPTYSETKERKVIKRQKQAVKAERLLNESIGNNFFKKSLSR